MSDKAQRNMWIVTGLGFSIGCIGRFSHEGFTFNTVLQAIAAILAFINVWIRHKQIKETQKNNI